MSVYHHTQQKSMILLGFGQLSLTVCVNTSLCCLKYNFKLKQLI